MAEPDLIGLYQAFLTAFNARNIEHTMSFFAPYCRASMPGYDNAATHADQFRAAYIRDFRYRERPIVLRDIKLIWDPETGRRGVWVDTVDQNHDNRQLYTNYWFEPMPDSSWKFVWQEILRRKDPYCGDSL